MQKMLFFVSFVFLVSEKTEEGLTYMLWLIFCRHGVIHTQSLQKLLLEDDVTKPEDTVTQTVLMFESNKCLSNKPTNDMKI